jgi:hypothetical protein
MTAMKQRPSAVYSPTDYPGFVAVIDGACRVMNGTLRRKARVQVVDREAAWRKGEARSYKGR